MSDRRPALIRVNDRRRPMRPTPLLWIALMIVAVPIAVSLLQHATSGWVPEGDDAWVARRTRQVFSTDPPLIGQESTADEQPTDRGLSHPGPIAYYLLAIPYGMSGWSAVGIAVGTGLVVLAAAWAAVVAAWRAAGDSGALAASLALALMAVRLSQEWLVRPTSSTTIVFPLVALAFGLWAYLRGDRLGLGIAALAGTYALQTSLVVLPLAVVLMAATLGVAGWRRVRRGRGDLSRAGVVVIAVVALAWLPPVLEVFLSWPGNLIQLGEYLAASVGLVHRTNTTSGSLGLGAAAATIVTYVVGVPRLGEASLEGAAVWLVPLDELKRLRLVAAVLLAVGAAAWAWRRGSQALRCLLLVALPSGAIAVIAFAQRPTDNLYAQTYFVIWIQAVVAMAWTAIALVAIEVLIWLRARRAPAPSRVRREAPGSVPRPIALSVGLVAALVALVATVGDVNRQDSDVVVDLSAQIRADLPPGTYAIFGEGALPWSSTAKGVGLDLIAHGYDIHFTEWGGMVDEPRRRATPDDDLLLLTTEYPDLPDRSMLARRREPDRDVDLQVHLIPGGKYQDFCRSSGEVLRQELVRSDTGEAVTVGERLAAVQALDPGVVASQTPDGEASRLLADLEPGRGAALAALGGAAPDQPVATAGVDPAFDQTWAALTQAFAEVCDPPRAG